MWGLWATLLVLVLRSTAPDPQTGRLLSAGAVNAMCAATLQPPLLVQWLNSRSPTSGDIAIFTSVTRDIVESYAGYVLGVNHCFAVAHSHSFHVVDDHIDPDPRWNKVKILLDALDNSSRFFTNASAFVWLDADLMVLNFDLDTQKILDQHPDADLIMSRDKPSGPSVGNTGFIIVRRGPRARDFLSRWWSTFDRARCCDQHALTWLYDQASLSLAQRARVVFLPQSILNTDFPAWKTFGGADRVLHLAGLPTAYRVTTFRYAMAALCDAAEGLSAEARVEPPPQLGVTRELLQHAVRELVHLRLATLRRATTPADAVLLPARARDLRKELLDVMKMDDDERSAYVPTAEEETELLALLPQGFSRVFRALLPSCLALLSNASVSAEGMSILLDTVSSAIEMALAERRGHLPLSLAELEQVRGLLTAALAHPALAAEVVQGRLQYYQFKVVQIMAEACETKVCKVQWLREGVEAWRRMAATTEFKGTEYASAEPLKEFTELLAELGAMLCAARQYEEGLAMLEEAALIQQQTANSFEMLRMAPAEVMEQAALAQGDVLFNLGLCATERWEEGHLPSRQEAHRWLTDASRVLRGRDAAAPTKRLVESALARIGTGEERLDGNARGPLADISPIDSVVCAGPSEEDQPSPNPAPAKINAANNVTASDAAHTHKVRKFRRRSTTATL